MNSATNILKEEHRIIERMLNVLDLVSRNIEKVDIKIFEKIFDFIENFIDKCHHRKEETVLFPNLEIRGIPKIGGPIGVMLMEHEEAKEYVNKLKVAVANYYSGDKKAKDQIIKYINEYVFLLRQHIMKEDNVLFPMADNLISENENLEIIEKFEEIEGKTGKHEKYEKYIEEIENLLSA
jgi:Uncharacterized conserved protein